MAALKSIGLSSSVIRSLNSNVNNVIPMTRILNIDFSNQYPTDYTQPTLKWPLAWSVLYDYYRNYCRI